MVVDPTCHLRGSELLQVAPVTLLMLLIIRLEFSLVCFCILWVKVYEMNKVEVADDCCFCW